MRVTQSLSRLPFDIGRLKLRALMRSCRVADSDRMNRQQRNWISFLRSLIRYLSGCRSLILVLALIVSLITCQSVVAANAVGRSPGGFEVGTSGDFTYSIPIHAPPGPKGIRPNIALTYSSRSGKGPLGTGWSLGGLSAIYRCSLTNAQDGTPAPVTLTFSDRFCMDGKRLRLTSSDTLTNYGKASTTYQTELADFSNVTASSLLAGCSSVLTNGTVLVTGGMNKNFLNSAELYDPSTGVWTITGNMNYARAYHTASVLTNGKVLVTGGANNGCFE